MNSLDQLDEDSDIPKFQLTDANAKITGFFNLSNKVLVFTKDVYLGELGYSLGYSGIVCNSVLTDTGEDIFFLHVTAMYNCLNLEETIYYSPKGEEMGHDYGMGIKFPKFHANLIGDSNIFRIPQMKSSIFVKSDGLDDESDFYTKYKKLSAVGLNFKKI